MIFMFARPLSRILRVIVLLFVVVLLCLFPLQEASSQVNVALNKSYSLRPKPNYSHCTDERDILQLTDGRKNGSHWAKKSTVGWRVYKTIPEVTIDLGAIVTVDQVNIHSIGGGASSVYRPDFVIILVSNNGTDFKCAGIASTPNHPNPSGKLTCIPFAFSARGLKTNARFVRVILQPGSAYVFLDEIEVLAPFKHIPKVELRTDMLPLKDRKNLFELAEKHIQLRRETYAMERLIAQKNHNLDSAVKNQIEKDISHFTDDYLSESDRLPSSAELDRFLERLNSIRADFYKAIYQQPYVCISAKPFETLFADQIIEDGKIAEEINLKLWQNEYESAAVNIINCSRNPLTMVVSASPLTGLEHNSRQLFEIRRAVNVVARRKGSIADALLLQEEKPFTVKPGRTAQIWLKFRSFKLDAGKYKASLALFASASHGEKLPHNIIPINIEVYPIIFPDDIDIDVRNLAYPMRSDITRNNIAETAKDLKEHYTNVFVIPPENLPMPKHGSISTGGIVARSFSQTDKLISANSYAKTFLFFLRFKPERKDSGLFGIWMSDSWKRSFQTWLQDWVDHLQEIGIEYERFAMYPFDENLGDEFYQFAKQIKAIDPNIRIFANSFGQGPADFMRFKDLVDIWSFSLPQCHQHPGWLETVKGFGKKVWLHDSRGPGKANDPYGYYRLQPWWAFKYGLSGVGFWVYVDPVARQTSWDDTQTAMGYYGVVYGKAASPQNTSSEPIIPSRRWGAWREGVEDYVYLKQLEEVIMQLSNKEMSNKKQLIKQQVNKVLGNPRNTTGADQAREVITKALIEARDMASVSYR